jgi:DNA-binding MltR family transcriptional regulator
MAKKSSTKDSQRDTFSLCGDFVAELGSASPRAKAIVAASALDEVLARFLEKEFVDAKVANRLVRRPYAPLGTFAARIDAAYALRLVSKKQYDALCTIRAVRNHFAHSVNCRFSDDQIRDSCLALNLKYVVYPPGSEFDPETRFLMNASALCGQLDGAFRNWTDRGDHPSAYLDEW